MTSAASTETSRGYTGGKSGNGVYHFLINLIPPHRVYIEPFLGGGAILRNKRPAAVQIGMDRDRAALERFESFVMDNLLLIEGNAVELLESFVLPPDTFIFVDAPYLQSVRKSDRDMYNFEFKTDAEHAGLLELLNRIPAKILITHYESDFYFDHLPGWNHETFYSNDRAGNRRKESAFYNYPKPVALHDYRYLGADFREREKIRKQQRRWKRRLENMDLLQKQAMLSVIDELSSSADIFVDDRSTPKTAGVQVNEQTERQTD